MLVGLQNSSNKPVKHCWVAVRTSRAFKPLQGPLNPLKVVPCSSKHLRVATSSLSTSEVDPFTSTFRNISELPKTIFSEGTCPSSQKLDRLFFNLFYHVCGVYNNFGWVWERILKINGDCYDDEIFTKVKSLERN